MRRLLFPLLLLLILTFGLTTPAHATLINMGDGTIYDADLQLSWLQNANTNGAMIWSDANTWAENLVFAGFDNWRLPTTLQPDPTCSDGSVSWGYNCTGSEMGHLYYTEMGNSAGAFALTNTGDFTNLQTNNNYWSGTEYALSTTSAWAFDFNSGVQFVTLKGPAFYALAVSPGERSTSVPEPATVLLLGSGLAGMAALRKRFKV